MLYLKKADRKDIEKEWLFQREIPADANSFINDYCGISREDFDDALDTIIAQSKYHLKIFIKTGDKNVRIKRI